MNKRCRILLASLIMASLLLCPIVLLTPLCNELFDYILLGVVFIVFMVLSINYMHTVELRKESKLRSLTFLHKVHVYFSLFIIVQNTFLRHFPALLYFAIITTILYISLSAYIAYIEFRGKNYRYVCIYFIVIPMSVLLLL